MPVLLASFAHAEHIHWTLNRGDTWQAEVLMLRREAGSQRNFVPLPTVRKILRPSQWVFYYKEILQIIVCKKYVLSKACLNKNTHTKVCMLIG